MKTHAAADGWRCRADAPLHKLPDVRSLPVNIQEKIFFNCDAASQKTLAASTSCFRHFWHKAWTSTDRYGQQCASSSCERFRADNMDKAAQKLNHKCMRGQIVRKAIHTDRAPESHTLHGLDTLHFDVQGHFGQQELAYILQLQPEFLNALGYKLGTELIMYSSWPDQGHDLAESSGSMFMSLQLSCRRQAGLTDNELERLEALFFRLPQCLLDFKDRKHDDFIGHEVAIVCEPMWQCSTSPTALAAMQWGLPFGDIEFTAKATNLLK